MFSFGLLRLVAVTAAVNAASAQSSSSLPIVDLGYQLHQASSFNDTGRFYNFSNIRYAAPPVGNLRFAPPELPAVDRSSVQTGNVGRICPQALPAWSTDAFEVLEKLIQSLPLNDTTPYTPPVVNSSTVLPTQDPRASEDCLFLDVFVPEKILQSGNKSQTAPVLVWIYGGGYVNGDKSNNNPAGLLAASGNVSEGEVIYVAMNYRLGAFGWLSGPEFQANGGVSNAALMDQKLALEWVQSHIGQFGGDKNKVTVFGESAGGGSIMHQITAYGGTKGKVPFQQAIPQSPGWQPVSSQKQQDDTYHRLLNLTGSTSFTELRNLSVEDLIRANTIQVLQSPYGDFTYGPAVDGSFVPAQPGPLLAQGRFDNSVRVMVGHNAMEGPYFTPESTDSTEAIVTLLRGIWPYTTQSVLDYITTTLYPEVFDGTYPYTNNFERSSLLVAEGFFTCNTRYLSTALDNKTYSYLFDVAPAFHGFDIGYTYYLGGAVTPGNPLGVQNRTVAVALQDFITSFAKDGTPEAKGAIKFNMYGPDATVLDLGITGFKEVPDTNANSRCDWWQKALY